MNKSIQLTQSQIKAHENGATMLLFPIEQNILSMEDNYIEWKSRETTSEDEWTHKQPISMFKEIYAPLQVGDKDVWVKEEFADFGESKEDKEWIRYAYKSDYSQYKNIEELLEKAIDWQPASKMTKAQSRYTLKEILDVKIVRVQDITILEMEKISAGIIYDEDSTPTRIEEFKKVYSLSDNDYMFLVEHKR